MSKINLLPWREEVRKGLNKLFFSILGGMFFLSTIIIVFSDIYLSHRLAVENANIAYINNEMKNVAVEVAEVKKLQENKKQLIERMNIIQSLEVDRASIVRLLDMIPHVLPENVYLTGLSRIEDTGDQTNGINLGGGNPLVPAFTPPPAPADSAKNKAESPKIFQKTYLVSMEGVAVTNGSISVLLKNLEAIKWVSNINLNEVSINKDGEGLDFKLGFVQNLTGTE